MIKGSMQALFMVHNLKKSVEFYTQVCGFDFAGVWDPETKQPTQNVQDLDKMYYAAVKGGDALIGLCMPDDSVKFGNSVQLHIEVDNADTYCADLKSKGANVEDPQDMPWGWRMFTMTDIDGHKIDFWHQLS